MHVFVFGSHTGFSPGHSLPFVQPTHRLTETSQFGLSPTHAVLFVAVHCTQNISGSLQAGASIEQFASLVQPSVHFFVCVLQTPFGPVHCALVTHWTHSFATLSQTGSAVVQALTFGSKHS
jgi:hypothetical protein